MGAIGGLGPHAQPEPSNQEHGHHCFADRFMLLACAPEQREEMSAAAECREQCPRVEVRSPRNGINCKAATPSLPYPLYRHYLFLTPRSASLRMCTSPRKAHLNTGTHLPCPIAPVRLGWLAVAFAPPRLCLVFSMAVIRNWKLRFGLRHQCQSDARERRQSKLSNTPHLARISPTCQTQTSPAFFQSSRHLAPAPFGRAPRPFI